MPPEEPRDSAITALLRAVTLVAAACAAAVIAAPWIFRVVREVPVLAAYPFHRVFDRVAVVAIVGALLLGWRWLRIRFSFRELLKRRHAVRRGVGWCAIGFACIAVLMLAQWHAGLRAVRPHDFPGVLNAVLIGLGSAVVVGFLEECFFRGFLFHTLRQHVRRYTAVCVTSALFASVHLFSLDYFLKPIKNLAPDGAQAMHWSAGVKLVALFLVPLGKPLTVLPGLVGLFLAGWLLAELTMRTRSLWPAIGLHAGWVWAIKVLGHVLKYQDPTPAGAGPVWFCGEKYAATGVLGWLLVGAVILAVNGLLAFAIYRPVTALAELMPHRVLVSLGRVAGRCAYVVCKRQGRIARENLRTALPAVSTAGIEQIVKSSFETLCVVTLEMLSFKSMVRDFPHLVKLTGLEHVEAARATGRPIIFFTGHLGSWEVLALSCGVLNFPFTAIARPLDNEWIYGHVRNLRQRSGIKLLDKKEIAGDVLRILRAREMVGFVGDQYAGSRGAFIEFFGRPASTSPAMALFARKTNAVIICAFDHVLPDGTHSPVIHPPIEVARTANAAADVFAATQQMMALLEAGIRRSPGQWLWMHRKWRPRKPMPASPATP